MLVHAGCMNIAEEIARKIREAEAEKAAEEANGGGDPMAAQYLEGRIKTLEEVLEMVQ